MKNKISIAQALRETKTQQARISKLIFEINPLATRTKDTQVIQGKTIEQFEEKAKSTHQQLTQLFKNHTQVREKIAAANAVNKITIGGQEYSVAAAIERKGSIAFEQTYLSQLMSYQTAQRKVTQTNESTVKAQAEKAAEGVFGKKEGNTNNVEYEEAVTKYIARNTLTLVDPLKIDDLIEKLDKDITDFLTEVDYKLNESNVNNSIEIDDDVTA